MSKNNLIPVSDMFSDDAACDGKKEVSWKMVTNQHNLLYMLASGLIMPPKGYGKKYYTDTLSVFPGWIPIFNGAVPQAAIAQSVSEKSHLLPCVLSLDIAHLTGPVKMVCLNDEVKDVVFHDGIEKDCLFLLVPAPLPASWITSIAFQSREDKKKCEKDAEDYNNVPLSDYDRKVSAAEFKQLNIFTWPPTALMVNSLDVNLDAPMAAGGIMALLVRLANRSDLAMQASMLAFQPELAIPELSNFPIMAGFSGWLKCGKMIGSADPGNLFWGVIDNVAACRSSHDQSTAVDVALDFLESYSNKLDEKAKQSGLKLAEDLRSLAGFADSSVSKIFELHPTPMRRALTIFVLRENISGFLDYRNDVLNEIDYILAAILFAARDGWLGMSTELRGNLELQNYVSHAMAAMAHRISSTGISIGAVPLRPKSLRELFLAESNFWTKQQNEAALVMARDCHWPCIKTRITIGKGEYQLLVNGSGMQIVLDGEAKAVVTEVDRNAFMTAFSQYKITNKMDAKIRQILKENSSV